MNNKEYKMFLAFLNESKKLKEYCIKKRDEGNCGNCFFVLRDICLFVFVLRDICLFGDHPSDWNVDILIRRLNSLKKK